MVIRLFFYVLVALALGDDLYGQSTSGKASFDTLAKPRVLVMTDITNEPDDQESLVRFLVYSNEYDVEGLIATTSVHLKTKVAKEVILRVIDAYDSVRGNLLLHKKGFPSKAQLQKVTKAHLPLFGMEGVGHGKSSEGSKLIIEAVDRQDKRPLWIAAWGGTNCLAQALWEVKNTRSLQELKKFSSKIRVYSISDQDDAGRWIRTEFPDVTYIVSPSGMSAIEYHKATWTGISGDSLFQNGPMHKFHLVTNEWLEQNVIKGHGQLGAMYPRFDYIMEGDTPSFLGLIENGLGSAFSPSYGGWGGRYMLEQTYAETRKIWTNVAHSRDEVVGDDGRKYVSDQATIWRWREAYQNDFAARMDWCVSKKDNANHNPVVVLNGNKGSSILRITARPGDTLSFDTKGSYDDDTDNLLFNWYYYKEAAGWFSGKLPDAFDIKNPHDSKLQLVIPETQRPFEMHLICEVKDDGTPQLYTYRRIVIAITPRS